MVERRRILITNDDGYTAEGLQVLADALEGMAEVWVVAPNSEQSGVSHALTLDRPLRLERLGERLDLPAAADRLPPEQCQYDGQKDREFDRVE